MKKPADLRAHLLATVPHIKADEKKMHLFIERGTVACRAGSLSFEYRYDVELHVYDYADHADTLMVPLLAWIAMHQPSILQSSSNEEAIKFEAEQLDATTADIKITMRLSEAVLVEPNGAGGYTAEHLPEPALPDLGGETDWRVFVNDVPLDQL